MRRIIFGMSFIALLASCQSIDGRVAELTANIQKYCVKLETAADLAEVVANRPLVTKINQGIQTYCKQQITDVPSAIVALANIMKAVNAAGINP